MSRIMWCDECRDWLIAVDGVTAIYDHDAWWCAKHVKIHSWENGKPIVDFPSPGKLKLGTIFYSNDGYHKWQYPEETHELPLDTTVDEIRESFQKAGWESGIAL